MESKLPEDLQKMVDDCVKFCAEKQNHLSPHIPIRSAVEAWAENYATLRAKADAMEKALGNIRDAVEPANERESRIWIQEARQIASEALPTESQPFNKELFDVISNAEKSKEEDWQELKKKLDKGDGYPNTPEMDLILRIVANWGNAIEMPKMERWLREYKVSEKQVYAYWKDGTIDL
jgi:hypothetical protein